MGPDKADITPHIEPSILNALPHYLPLGIFPLILAAAVYGGWWLLPPFLFMSVAGPLDRALGPDGRNMDPAKTPERRLLWHNLPVWTWAFLWPPTLIFGMWQILVAQQFAVWEAVILVILLTMEAQAVFVVGHELVHRRSAWERRLGEFLLSSASYPQYSTEHVYIHHAKVGTPLDVGSAPKGESFWRYFPREVVKQRHPLLGVCRRTPGAARFAPVALQQSVLALRRVRRVLVWPGVLDGRGSGRCLVFVFLGLSCVFSMKISNYFQHYGLRRVLQPNGRWEKVMPRHSWDADWKFSNWMFFNMQRHADHHAAASRHYPLLQVRSADDTPELPGTYADMMNIVLRPKRWFAKMDPLVDQWRKHFYPEIEDWSPYDSPISAERPDAFEAIAEIFGAAPRLAKRIERSPALLDSLQDREFTDLDLPRGFGPDRETEAIARRGLARLYWTLEMGVREMKDLIAELPTADAGGIRRDRAELVQRQGISNRHARRPRKPVAGGGEGPRCRISPKRRFRPCLAPWWRTSSNGAGPLRASGVAAVFLGDLASREVHPGAAIDMLFVQDGEPSGENERLCRRFRETLTDLARDSLLFSPIPPGSKSLLALPLSELAERCGKPGPGGIPVLTRARCMFESDDSGTGRRFDEARREVLAECAANESLLAPPRVAPEDPAGTGVAAYARTRGGLDDVERAARFLQLTHAGADLDDPAPTAAAVLGAAGDEPLAQAAALWRDLQGVTRLVGEEGFDVSTAGPKVKSLVAEACGHEDFHALEAAVAETASRAAARIETLLSR